MRLWLLALLVAQAAHAASPAPPRSPASRPPGGPVKVTDPKHRFQITLPGPARQASVPAFTTAGFRTRESWSADGDGGTVHFDVSTVDYPPGMKLDTSGFDELVGVAAAFCDAGYPRSLTVCGWPARETRVQVPFASHLWQRAIFAGDRLVQVIVMRDNGPFTKADEQVVESLKLVDLWNTVADPPTGFRASLPAEVTPTTTGVVLPFGTAQVKTWQVPREAGQLSYAISLCTYPDVPFDADRALHGAADKILESFPSASTGRREIRLADATGLEIRGTIKPKGYFAIRLYFRKHYLYQATVIAAGDAVIGPREEDFLSSFQLDPLR